MYSPWLTQFWFLFGRDHCHKASDKKTIMTPTQLREKNEINQELVTPRQSQGVSSEPSPDHIHWMLKISFQIHTAIRAFI